MKILQLIATGSELLYASMMTLFKTQGGISQGDRKCKVLFFNQGGLIVETIKTGVKFYLKPINPIFSK